MKTQSDHESVALGFVEFMMEKEAAVFGARAPDMVDVDHSGIPYEARRRAYQEYVGEKAREKPTGVLRGGLTGAGIGAGVLGGLGYLSGSGRTARQGAVIGGLLGGIMGGSAGFEDMREIQKAKSALISRDRLDDQLQRRMASRQARRENEERQSRNMFMYGIAARAARGHRD
jgi:hypothetical protein